MKKPPITVNYVLMCDDVRNEAGGKSTIIGLYNEDMLLGGGNEQFIGPLAFLVSATLPPKKKVPVTLWIEGPNGQRMQESSYGEVQRDEGVRTNAANMIWRVFPWISHGFGSYKLHLTQGGHDSVIHEWKLGKQN